MPFRWYTLSYMYHRNHSIVVLGKYQKQTAKDQRQPEKRHFLILDASPAFTIAATLSMHVVPSYSFPAAMCFSASSCYMFRQIHLLRLCALTHHRAICTVKFISSTYALQRTTCHRRSGFMKKVRANGVGRILILCLIFFLCVV